MAKLGNNGLARLLTKISTWVNNKFSSLATVATSGSYTDLSDKPTIPTVNNATLTIQQNSTNVQTFTANQATAATANIQCVDLSSNQIIGGIKTFSQEVTMFGRDINLMSRLHYGKDSNPSASTWQYIFFRGNTALEGYTNAWYSGYLEQVVGTDGSARGRWAVRRTDETMIASVELLAAMDDTLTFRPTNNNAMQLGDTSRAWKRVYSNAYYLGATAFGDIVTHNASEFASVSDLSTVATSGSYTDLSDKPTIPTVNNATLTIQKNGTTVNTFTANASSNVTCNITVPTNTNELTNGAGFVTSNHTHSEYDAMTNAEIDAILADVFEDNNS